MSEAFGKAPPNQHAEHIGWTGQPQPTLLARADEVINRVTSGFDPDCVKTRASQERAELFSQ
jgi:hypothetical protein